MGPPQYLGQESVLLRLLKFPSQLGNAQVPSARIDIDKVNIRTTVAATVCRCDECIRHGPKPVARTQFQPQAGDVQSRGCTDHSDSKFGVHSRSDGLLETRHGGSLGKEIRLQNLNDRIDIGLSDILTTVRNHQMPARWLNSIISSIVRKCLLLPE